MEKSLKELINGLIPAIISVMAKGTGTGMIESEYARYFRWKLKEYKYGDTGIIKKSATGEEILKLEWGKTTKNILKNVRRLRIYSNIRSAILQDYEVNKVDCERYLDRLIEKTIGDILSSKIKNETDFTKYICSFLKDLARENQEYRAEVQIYGLILQPRSIQLDGNVRLRKPNRKDFEREVPMGFLPQPRTLADPTAFLHTRVYATEREMSLQNEIEREIAVLRLFRVGAVQDIQYTTDTDSIVHMGFSTLTRGRLLGSDKYLITREDVELLKRFYSNMKRVTLPSSVRTGEQKEADYLSIAYDRYNDSLEGHVVEKRVSSAVMGLEALYLGAGEQQEMSYRLRMRVSKLLSLISFDPNETRERIKDAYEIRSKYVHGGLLNQKGRQKIERKHGDINEFPKTIMDYLRASIVALLRRPSKNSLIQKIDDSFLDSSKEEEIKTILFIPY